ncbi:MAG: hypothetical protein Q7U47_10390 [Paludibacter sp.]|nr:hypothetical protein [Paludibacter sp.]
MNRLNNKLILIFTAIILVSGWGGWWLLNDILHLPHIELYPVIPAFYFVLGTSMINVLTRIKRNDERKVVNIYMILKLSKFILSAIAVMILFFYAKDNSKVLLIIFACFYLIYIFCEVFFYSQVEKTEKAKKKNE